MAARVRVTTTYNNKSVDALNTFLNTLRQILSEMYHTCDTKEERISFKQFIISTNKIVA